MTSLPVQLLNNQLQREMGKPQLGYFCKWCGMNEDGHMRGAASSKWMAQFVGGQSPPVVAIFAFICSGRQIQISHL